MTDFPGLESHFEITCEHGHTGFCIHGCFSEQDTKEIGVIKMYPIKLEVVNKLLQEKYAEARRRTANLSEIYREINELEGLRNRLINPETPPYDGEL